MIKQYEIKYGEDTLDKIKKIILSKLEFNIKSKENIKEFFKEHRFYSFLKDLRGINHTFTIVQYLTEDETFVINKISFEKERTVNDDKVYFKVNFETTLTPFNEMSNCFKLEDVAKEQKEKYNISAFFVEDFVAYNAFTRLANNQIEIIEYCYSLGLLEKSRFYNMEI